MKLARIFYFSLLIVTAGLWVSEIAHARMPDDLKLAEISARKIIISPKPNPHDIIECTDCHSSRPLEIPEFSLDKPVPQYVENDYSEELCTRCHIKSCVFENHLVDPEEIQLKVKLPDKMPLKFVYEGKTKITCVTCHDVHYPHNAFMLLRGYSINPKTHPSVYNTRLEFCKGCHGDTIDILSPHKMQSGQQRCTFCHLNRPSKEKSEPLKENINSLCSICHPVSPEPHYLHFNPFPDLKRNKLSSFNLPMPGGTFTCTTCHLQHSSSVYHPYLRSEYVSLTRESILINPHEQKTFCLSCHTETPIKDSSNQIAALLEKDITRLCDRCHGSRKITGMYHPLVKIPDGFKVPVDLPFDKEGRITCATCHQVKPAMISPDNPKLLRGSPYPQLRTLCWKCHQMDTLAGRNVHEEYDQNYGCEICHHPGDTYRSENVIAGPLKADPNFLCLLCHEDFPHPASYKHNIRPGLYEYVTLDKNSFPLDQFNRITCYTCHEIHEKFTENIFLRNTSGVEQASICKNCHPY